MNDACVAELGDITQEVQRDDGPRLKARGLIGQGGKKLWFSWVETPDRQIFYNHKIP
jgi:hypothetical protein